jgi:hypothetical protein
MHCGSRPSGPGLSAATRHPAAAAVLVWHRPSTPNRGGCRYDDGSKGFLDLSDLKCALHDLGLLDAVRDKDHFAASQFALADKSRTATLSLPEFSAYYSSLVFAGAHPYLAAYVVWAKGQECRMGVCAFVCVCVCVRAFAGMCGWPKMLWYGTAQCRAARPASCAR